MKLSELYQRKRKGYGALTHNATERRAILRRTVDLSLFAGMDPTLPASAVRDKLPETVLLALLTGKISADEIRQAIMAKSAPYGRPVNLNAGNIIDAVAAGFYDHIELATKEEEEESNMDFDTSTRIISSVLQVLVQHTDEVGTRAQTIKSLLETDTLNEALINCGMDEAARTAAKAYVNLKLDGDEGDAFIHSIYDTKVGDEQIAKIVTEALGGKKDNDTPDTKSEEVEISITLKPEFKQLVDMALSQATGGAYGSMDKIIDLLKEAHKARSEAERQAKRLSERLRQVATTPTGKVMGGGQKAETAVSAVPPEMWASFPSGEVGKARAMDLFLSPTGKKSKTLDFDVPFFTWDFDHPLVPKINPDYQFKPGQLLMFLWGLNNRKNIWLHGHTGTGKTTFVEQVCARLGWPFMRVNLDSEITRLDLIGRDVLSSDDKGGTKSHFVEGILPQAMQLQGMGAVLCCDEISFGRPDVMYVFQRVLEEKGLLLNEDGGRLIPPGPWFRIVATDNTRGQGDELGAYAGARPQSAAFLDRFTCWIEFKYMDKKDEAMLIQSVVPTLSAKEAEQIAAFAFEVRKAFGNGEIFQTVSPRGTQSFGEAFAFFNSIVANPRMAIDLAADCCVLAKASEQDRQVIKGLYDRTFGAM